MKKLLPIVLLMALILSACVSSSGPSTNIKVTFTDFHFTPDTYTIPAGKEIHLVLDNYATHKTPKVAAWFKRRPRYHLHFTPTSGSWLNQVERWFAKITEQRIRRGVFKNIDELIAAIDEFIARNNKNPKPFIWTATPELILDRVGRLCKRTNRSVH